MEGIKLAIALSSGVFVFMCIIIAALKSGMSRNQLLPYIHTLVDAGCNINLENRDMKTCVDIARSFDNAFCTAALYRKPPMASIMTTGMKVNVSYPEKYYSVYHVHITV